MRVLSIALCALTLYGTSAPTANAQARRPTAAQRAQQMYAAAREAEARADYHRARALCEASLRLREDPAVRRFCLRVMATIGPM